MITEVIFDIETQKLFADISSQNPADLGVSLVSVYHRQLDDQLHEIKGQMFSFFPDQMSGLWSLFANVDRAIGFNSLNFDVPILAPLAPFDLTKIKHFDILDHVYQSAGHRVGLDRLAKSTIGISKTDVGTNAVLYWQQNTPESLAKLKEYCEADVALTRDLYDYGLMHGHLKYLDRWNTPRTVNVDFSYPPPSPSDHQMGLF